MSSIIEGYNYDIFISYRQKDNKGDRWVSEFVEALKTELESTFKEEISVYFDSNPHDGLLETHDVDESLKEKLKCLIFIPIISRTYCDPKSFAWEHEFKAFIEQASKDQFGLKVKLPNGNVASRVLPVRIHDLENEDVKCFEGVTGTVMRTLDFVFKTSSGVNRPLKSREDHPGDNLNKTYYQDQINKVALAIKEIVQGMKTEPSQLVKVKDQSEKSFKAIKEDRKIDFEPHTKTGKWKLLSAVIIVAILIIASVFAYPKLFKQDTLKSLREKGEISVAVIPFQNMTNDTTWNVWQDGIQNELITSLTNSEELKVRQTESINSLLQSKGLTNYASITPSVASKISQKLEANVFIYGSIKQVGTTIRLNALLIDTKTEETFKSFQIDGIADNILHITDSLSVMLKNFLIITVLEKELTQDYRSYVSTTSPQAYKYFINGMNFFYKGDYSTAINLLLQALDIDSNFLPAKIIVGFSYGNQGNYKEAKNWTLKLCEEKEQIPMMLKIWAGIVYAMYFETPYEEIKYLKQCQKIDDKMAVLYYQLGRAYLKLNQYDKAIPEFEKSLEIYNEQGIKPVWIYNYTLLGLDYHKTGQYKKEKKLYKKAKEDFPDDPDLIYRRSVLALTERDTVEANRYIKRYISIRKEHPWDEAQIAYEMANIYSEAELQDEAENYFRQAASVYQLKDPYYLNKLAYFLIDNDRNIGEGLELADKVLELNPDNFYYLHTQGWGLYKLGKYKEALEILQKSWDIRREKSIYNHEAYLHLEAAKKAVLGYKNN